MSAAALPGYASIIQQLMGAAPPSSAELANNPIAGFVNMTDAANTANYNRGTGILQLLAQQGGTSKANNQDAFQQEQGQIQQSAVSRGLTGSSVVDNLKAGATRDLTRANNAVDEHTALDMANTANSFNQQAPDMGLLASLIGAGGGGGAGTKVTGGGGGGGGGGAAVAASLGGGGGGGNAFAQAAKRALANLGTIPRPPSGMLAYGYRGPGSQYITQGFPG